MTMETKTFWSKASGGIWLGIRITPDVSEVTPTTNQVKLTCEWIVQSDGTKAHNFSSTMHRWGSFISNVSFSFKSSKGYKTEKIIKTEILTRETHSWSQDLTFHADVGPLSNGGRPVAYGQYTIDKWVPGKPWSPRTLSAERLGADKIKLSWRVRTETAYPWTITEIQRESDLEPDKWVVAFTDTSGAESWTDTGLKAGARYRYWIRSGNSAHWSDVGAYSEWITTTPPVPENVTAQLDISNSMVVRWEVRSKFPNQQYEVWRQQGTGAWSKVATVSTTTWVDRSPGKKDVTYKVKTIVTDTNASSPFSSTTRTMTPAQEPGVPSAISPKGDNFEPGWITLKWLHNSIDSSLQTAAVVRWRHNRDPWQEIRDITTNTSKPVHLVEAGSYEWQVKTWGAYLQGNANGASKWSAVATFQIYDKPTVRINTPVNEGTNQRSSLLLDFTYYQKQSRKMTACEVTVSGTSGKTIYRKTFTGTKTRFTLPDMEFGNGWRSKISVRVMSDTGAWSNWTSAWVNTRYPTPDTPAMELVWDETTASMNITMLNPTPTSGHDPATHNKLWMRKNTWDETAGGDGWRRGPWELVAEDVKPNTTVTDPRAGSGSNNEYKLTAYTSQGAKSTNAYKSLFVRSKKVFLSTPNGDVLLPIIYDAKLSYKPSLVNRQLHYFAGRKHAVELAGQEQRMNVELSFTLFDDQRAERRALLTLAQMPGPFLLRSPLEDRMWVTINSVSMPRNTNGTWDVSISMTDLEEAAPRPIQSGSQIIDH